jgi:hypothetical protein
MNLKLSCALVALLAAALLLPWGAAPVAAQEQVTRSFTFEGLPDGVAIGGRLPGLRFIDEGKAWRFADVRTGRYNAPHPAACPSFGGPCAYAVDGSGFAWVGASGGSGAIAFASGPETAFATAFSAGFSTSGPLVITAIGPTGETIATRQVAANIRTGRLEEVSFAAPAIARVRIEGSANAWVMDNLRATMPASAFDGDTVLEEAAEAAAVVVVQRVAAPPLLAPGSPLTLTVIATNHGRGQALETTISLPLDPAQVRLSDATFTRGTAWVSALTPEGVQIKTGLLHSQGDTITATLQLAIAPEARAGYAFGGRLSYTWLDRSVGGNGRSNRLDLTVGEAAPPAVATLQPALQAQSGASRIFGASIFAPGEPVALWHHTPSGQVVPQGRLTADGEGAISVELRAEQPGPYRLVATGIWSGQVAAADLVVP